MSVNENPETSLIDPITALGAMVVLMLQSLYISAGESGILNET
ncbi:hypothetical protein [Bartonella queenslandensis]|nr:hypothetical protein [Bartonella queenslandensis]